MRGLYYQRPPGTEVFVARTPAYLRYGMAHVEFALRVLIHPHPRLREVRDRGGLTHSGVVVRKRLGGPSGEKRQQHQGSDHRPEGRFAFLARTLANDKGRIPNTTVSFRNRKREEHTITPVRDTENFTSSDNRLVASLLKEQRSRRT